MSEVVVLDSSDTLGSIVDTADELDNTVQAITVAIDKIQEQTTTEGAVIAMESAMAQLDLLFHSKGMGPLIQTRLSRAFESNFDSPVEAPIAFLQDLRDVRKDLVIAHEGLLADAYRATTDWFEYGREAAAKQAQEAQTLLLEIESLAHDKPLKANVDFPGANNFGYGGEVTANAAIDGYSNLVKVVSTLETDFLGLFRKYLHDMAKIFRDTASITDRTTYRAVALVLFALFAGNIVATALLGGAIVGGILHSKNVGGRPEKIKKSIDTSIGRLREFVADYRKHFGRTRFSGDRTIALALNASGSLASVDILRNSKLSSTYQGKAWSIKEMNEILNMIIDHSTMFKHRSDIKEHLIKVIDKEIFDLHEYGDTANQHGATVTAAHRASSFGLKLYWKPLTELGKVQLSVNRSLLAAIRANLKAY